MKKKLILSSSLAALSLAAVISLTSCGGINTGNVKTVTPEVLDSTLVQNTKSNYFSRFITSKNSAHNGGYLVISAENKVTNVATGKSVTIENLSSYSTSTKNFYFGNYNTYLFITEKEIDTTKSLYTVYDNNMEKLTEFEKRKSSYVNYNYSRSGTTQRDGKRIYYCYMDISYSDPNDVTQKKSPYIELDVDTNSVTTKAFEEKDSSSVGFSQIQNGVYVKITEEEENSIYHFYDASYSEICELKTKVELTFSLTLDNKIYAQGFRVVDESYKNAIAVYNSKDSYFYFDVYTYCIDLENKKAKEIDTEVLFINDIGGNKSSEYFVADYYKITNNFVDTKFTYTGFFKDGELEYKLPVTVSSISSIKKYGDNYLIENNDISNVYDKDMKLIKSDVDVQGYGIYGDTKDFKNNFYDVTGNCIYSTENKVDTNNLYNYGYAIEKVDGVATKALVFTDGTLKTIELNDKISFRSGLMITQDATNNKKYTISQPGGSASIVVYSNDLNFYGYSYDTYSLYEFYSAVYTDEAMSDTVYYFYGVY